MGVVIEIGGHVGMVGKTQHALHWTIGSGADGGVDLFDRGITSGFEDQIDDRDVWRRDADRHAIQLARQFRQHKPHRLGRPGRGRDHRQCRGAGAVEIATHVIQRRLVAGIAVDRGHETLGDPDGVIQGFGDRRQAVGGAGCVGNNGVSRRQRFVIDPVDDGLVGTGRRGRHQHAFGSVFKMQDSFVAVGEKAGAFHRDVDVTPRQVFRIADRRDLDPATAHVDPVLARRDLSGETPVHAVEPQ